MKQKNLKKNAHLYKNYDQIYAEEMEKSQKIRERMQYLIDKYDIDVSQRENLTNEEKYRAKGNTDQRVFFGYKKKKFFDDKDAMAEINLKKASSLISRIVDHVTMKEEMSLLAQLAHKHLKPKQIESLVQRLTFIPIKWNYDPAIYTDQLMPPPTARDESENRSAEENDNKSAAE